MLSACSGNAGSIQRKILQQIRCNNYGCRDFNSLAAEIPCLMQPLLSLFSVNTANTAHSNKNLNIRKFSTLPPQPPPYQGGGNTGSGGGNFRRGANGGGGTGTFRLPRPDPRGGFNGGGRGGRGGRTGGGGGNFGRGRGRGRGGSDFEGNRDFGLGGGGGSSGEGTGRNSPHSLNKKNVFGNPEPFITSAKGTRTNAVTIFPGNYDDADDGYSDDEYAFDDEENDNDDETDADSTKLYDPAFIPDDPNEIAQQKMMKEHLLKEQEKREKWIDNALPPERVSMIDERGRAYGRGGRKRAQARVWIQPGLGEVIVNRRRFTDYFDRLYDREQVLAPFVATETCNMFDVQIMVKGGGLTGQAGAIRLGVARALNAYNPDLYRPPLKLLGYLTRDPRKVERKKIGHTKARKSPQWVRR